MDLEGDQGRPFFKDGNERGRVSLHELFCVLFLRFGL